MQAMIRLFRRRRAFMLTFSLEVILLFSLGLLLSCSNGPNKPENRPPQITKFRIVTGEAELNPSLTNRIAGGTTIEFEVAASDPDGDNLVFRWLCSAGTLSDSIGMSVDWTAPTFSTEAIVSVEVSDGQTSAGRGTTFQIWTASKLAIGGVTPGSGVITDIFTFKVTFTDPDNQLPKAAKIMIDGETYPLNLTDGNPVTGTIYEYVVNLSAGSHQYRFEFIDYRDSSLAYPSGGYAVGPLVSNNPSQIPWDSLIVIDELDNVGLVDVKGIEYEFDYWGLPPDIRPGAILVGSEKDGFLRRVVNVDVQPNKMNIITRDAPLDSAIMKSIMDTTFLAKISGIGSSPKLGFSATYLAAGVTVTNELINISGTKLFDGRVGGVDVEAVITDGRVDFTPELDIGWELWFGIKEFHAVASGDLDFVCDVEITADGHFSLHDSTLIGRFVHDQYFAIGIVPVMVRYTLSFMAEIEANADMNGRVECGFEFLNHVSAGAEYKNNNWRSIWNYEKKLIPHKPEWSAEAQLAARACIKPRLNIELYTVAGPYIEIEPYLGLDASFTAPPPCYDWELYAGVDGYLGFRAHILSFELANYNTQLLAYRATLASDKGCICREPETPSLSSPSNGATNQSQPVYLDWGSVSGADKYQVQVDNSSSFSSPEIDTQPTASNYSASGLSSGTKYYWRVRAYNSCGWGSWSSSWNFTTSSQTADLALTNLVVSPSTVSTRAFTSCSFNIVNHGPMALSSEYVTVDYYLSTDQTFGDADDVKIGDTGITLSISNGGTSPITLSSTGLSNMVRYWPEDHPCGDYYVYARVTITNPPPNDPNSGNNYDRTNSTINYTGCAQTADLALTNLVVSPSTVSSRAFTSCSFYIVNHGPMALSLEYVTVDYYLSTDQTFGDADDVKIGDTGITLSISNGGTYPITLSSTGLSNMVRYWPEDHPCGDYYVYARVTITNPPPNDPNSGNNYDRTNSTINYTGCAATHLYGGYDISDGTIVEYGNWPSQYISLQMGTVDVESDAQNGTSPWHWKLYYENVSYVQLTFHHAAIPYPDSMKLWFHALGSTSQGISYAYVRVLVNGTEIVDCRNLSEEWVWYYLNWSTLQNYLISGENTFRIELAGGCHSSQTNAWIKNIKVEGWTSSSATQNFGVGGPEFQKPTPGILNELRRERDIEEILR
ncbi:fibronectin type III domain-containing protein [Candidatus Zixiibacteriota bacterium]